MGIKIIFRPLLVSGMLAGDAHGDLSILIDSEQDEFEQTCAICHELLHVLGLRDENRVEEIALKLAAACPKLALLVREEQGRLGG